MKGTNQDMKFKMIGTSAISGSQKPIITTHMINSLEIMLMN